MLQGSRLSATIKRKGTSIHHCGTSGVKKVFEKLLPTNLLCCVVQRFLFTLQTAVLLAKYDYRTTN